MRTFIYVWVWFAFSILGFTFLKKAETLAKTQDFQSNFLITSDSEHVAILSPVYTDKAICPWLFYMDTLGLLGPKVLGFSQIAAFKAEIYGETSSKNTFSSRINSQVKSLINGSEIPLKQTEIKRTEQKREKPVNPFRVENIEIIAQDRIRITFSDYPDPGSVIIPDHYSISGSSPREILLRENLYQIDLYLSKPLRLEEHVEVVLHTLRSREGLEERDLILNVFYADNITAIMAVNKNTLRLYHDEPLNMESVDASSFHMIDGNFNFRIEESGLPDILELRVSPDLEEGQSYQLFIPHRQSQKGELIPGSMRTFSLDLSPPEIIRLTKHDTHKLSIHFNEAIDPVMAVVPEHYELNGHNPIEVYTGDKPNQIILVIEEEVKLGMEYELLIEKIEDLNGNSIENTARLYTAHETANNPEFKSIVINEVMAAPRAGLELPNSEYVELLNMGQDAIDISGFNLHNSRTSTAIPANTIISPGEYLILCPNARRPLFEPFGRTIGLTRWPVLLNNADIVMLSDIDGNLIDSLGYTRSNYGSTQIAQGGYSLEVVNPHSQCNLISNLRPSTSPLRGTPGKINSVFDDTPDRTPPKLVEVYAIHDTLLLAVFSKPMSDNLTGVQWTISPNVNLAQIQFMNIEQTEILLSLTHPLEEGALYTLQVTNIRDCAGNLIKEGSSYTFALPLAAEAGDIVLNEILFNPHAGTPKFVEIYNSSNKYINLRNWKLGNEVGGMISNRRVISGHDLVMAPHTYRAITTDPIMLTQIYPKAVNLLEMGTLPSYPIREGTVFLLSPDEDLVERMDYHEGLHHPLLRTPRGVSLERINPLLQPNDPNNWTSAAGAVGFATPGFKNSQKFADQHLAQGITVTPEVFAPETAGAQNYTTIQYQMDTPGYVGTIKIYDISGKLIKEIVQNEIWGTTGFYTWNGTDMSGNKVRIGYYIIWIELLNLEGKVINLKKTVAVGAKIR